MSVCAVFIGLVEGLSIQCPLNGILGLEDYEESNSRCGPLQSASSISTLDSITSMKAENKDRHSILHLAFKPCCQSWQWFPLPFLIMLAYKLNFDRTFFLRSGEPLNQSTEIILKEEWALGKKKFEVRN